MKERGNVKGKETGKIIEQKSNEKEKEKKGNYKERKGKEKKRKGHESTESKEGK